MNLILYQIDAFTDKLFKGNPAAVIPLDYWIDEELMQHIAMENNLAETAFICPAFSDSEEAVSKGAASFLFSVFEAGLFTNGCR